jgi:hypothetical protein
MCVCVCARVRACANECHYMKDAPFLCYLHVLLVHLQFRNIGKIHGNLMHTKAKTILLTHHK